MRKHTQAANDNTLTEALSPLAVSIDATKRLTSLGNTTVFALIKDGRLKTVKVGRRTLVLVDSIDRLLTASN